MNAELLTVLENLVQLKRWKDKHGKDEHYQRNIQPVWNAAFSTYNKYASNPHLLKEGENEPNYTDADIIKRNPDYLAPDNTAISGHNWEKEAENTLKKHGSIRNDYAAPEYFLEQDDAIAALTEMAQMAYERGREESMEYYGKMDRKHVTELQHQLEEKNARVDKLVIAGLSTTYNLADLRYQLAAANAEVERLRKI